MTDSKRGAVDYGKQSGTTENSAFAVQYGL